MSHTHLRVVESARAQVNEDAGKRNKKIRVTDTVNINVDEDTHGDLAVLSRRSNNTMLKTLVWAASVGAPILVQNIPSAKDIRSHDLPREGKLDYEVELLTPVKKLIGPERLEEMLEHCEKLGWRFSDLLAWLWDEHKGELEKARESHQSRGEERA